MKVFCCRKKQYDEVYSQAFSLSYQKSDDNATTGGASVQNPVLLNYSSTSYLSEQMSSFETLESAGEFRDCLKGVDLLAGMNSLESFERSRSSPSVLSGRSRGSVSNPSVYSDKSRKGATDSGSLTSLKGIEEYDEEFDPSIEVRMENDEARTLQEDSGDSMSAREYHIMSKYIAKKKKKASMRLLKVSGGSQSKSTSSLGSIPLRFWRRASSSRSGQSNEKLIDDEKEISSVSTKQESDISSERDVALLEHTRLDSGSFTSYIETIEL